MVKSRGQLKVLASTDLVSSPGDHHDVAAILGDGYGPMIDAFALHPL